MAQREVEMILLRQLTSYLAMPVFIVDPEGNLVYYNEPAELLLGQRFEETGEIPRDEWGATFDPVDEDGTPFPASELPLAIALEARRPAHRRFWLRGLDGTRRQIEATAFPLVGQAERFLGGIAFFWGVEPS